MADRVTGGLKSSSGFGAYSPSGVTGILNIREEE